MDSKMWNRFGITIFILIMTVGIAVFSSMQENNKAVSEQVDSIDFTANWSGIKVTTEEDMQYREGYFKVLQNEIPIIDEAGEKIYYKDLWRAGIDVAELWENKSETDFPYGIYYKDLDGDRKPELAINQGCFYIFQYELEQKVCRILYSEQSCYFGGILGEGELWYHDGLHANVIRDRYIVFDGRNEWKTVLDLEEWLGQSSEYPDYYRVGTGGTEAVMVDEGTWKLVTEPFF